MGSRPVVVQFAEHRAKMAFEIDDQTTVAQLRRRVEERIRSTAKFKLMIEIRRRPKKKPNKPNRR